MLNDASGVENVYIACGYTDLRYGIDGLSTLVKNKFELDPFQANTLFLFCGRKKDRIKGLLWEGDGKLGHYHREKDLPIA
ncbi:MAG: IS66 family insertion sequence element accessory protein TnpB [Eubacteriales bacterium]|nr:IS66 family insertion sequence element accessory protein TnpB [Eubacteriales bacterium]